MRSKLHTVVDEDDVESSQRRSMTIVVELECETREQVTEEEESF